MNRETAYAPMYVGTFEKMLTGHTSTIYKFNTLLMSYKTN